MEFVADFAATAAPTERFLAAYDDRDASGARETIHAVYAESLRDDGQFLDLCLTWSGMLSLTGTASKVFTKRSPRPERRGRKRRSQPHGKPTTRRGPGIAAASRLIDSWHRGITAAGTTMNDVITDADEQQLCDLFLQLGHEVHKLSKKLGGYGSFIEVAQLHLEAAVRAERLHGAALGRYSQVAPIGSLVVAMAAAGQYDFARHHLGQHLDVSSDLLGLWVILLFHTTESEPADVMLVLDHQGNPQRMTLRNAGSPNMSDDVGGLIHDIKTAAARDDPKLLDLACNRIPRLDLESRLLLLWMLPINLGFSVGKVRAGER